MEIQTSLWEKPVLPADIVYTPLRVSRGIIKELNPKGKCLDPCKGDGSFYNLMPKGSDYCEVCIEKIIFDARKITGLVNSVKCQTNGCNKEVLLHLDYCETCIEARADGIAIQENKNICSFKNCTDKVHNMNTNLCYRHNRLYELQAKADEAKPESKELFKNDFALAAGDISVTSQHGKILLVKREGKVYTKLTEIDIEQAFALAIAIKAVAACVKHSEG